MKNLIISGATGYVGSHLLEQIDGKQWNIIPLTETETVVKDGVTYYSFEDFLKMDEFTGETILLHLAFPRKSDPNLLFGIFDFTYQLYAHAKTLGASQIINISTQSVYDIKREHPASESDLLKPFNLYGIGKAYIEEWTTNFCQKHSLAAVNVRLGSVVGPEFDSRLTNRWIRSLMNGEAVEITEAGKLFSYIYIEDVISGLLAIINDLPIDQSGVYNLGATDAYTLTELIREIEQVVTLDSKPEVKITSVPRDVTTNAITTDKLFHEIGWQPTVTLQQMIEGVYDYYAET